MSTLSADGVRNLAPFSFFMMLSSSPFLLGFSSNGRSDTLNNAEVTGQFTWNLVSRELAEAMNQTSAEVAPDVDEVSLAGLSLLPSDVVAPGRVAASPVSVECEVTQIVPLVDSAGASADSWLVIGEAVRVHIRYSAVRDGTFETPLANPVFRGGGPTTYYALDPTTRFDMTRPHP